MPVTDEPFIVEHFVPPKNSFGQGETDFKTLNWQYFKTWLKEKFYWKLQGSPDGETWYDDSLGLLDVNIDWDEGEKTGKVTLTLDTTNAPMPLYYRFDLGCDTEIKEYISKVTNSIYELKLPVTETEDYDIYFDFSDIKPLIQNNKVTVQHGIKNIDSKDYIGFRVKTVNKIPVEIIFC